MADQAERVILEAEDQVTPVVGQANAGLDSFEKKAESAHGKVVRITDQTRSSIQRLIASLEKQAEVYGKSGADRLISQRDQLLQRYAKEPAAIDAITRSYEKMIAVEEKAAREAAVVKAAKEAEGALRSQSEAIKSFGDRVGQFMENPLQGARGAVSSVLSSLGPFGMGVMAGATALVGFGVAAFEAAKSLGAYGTQVKDAELRTGLTAKEVGQFSFAAKAMGQDISIVERLMRGLSQAADDNSREGEKARATLQRMGIDLRTAAGEMKPTSDILIEIAEGLNALPEGLQRDAAAMDLFKRVGIEAIPFMTELNHNLHIAHEEGFGPTEEDVRRFQEYQREVSVLETKWDALVRKFKEGLVITVSFVGKGVDWFLNNVGTAGDEARQQREEEQARQDAEQIRRAGGYGASMSRGAHRSLQSQMEGLAPGIMQDRDLIQRQIAEMQTEQQNLVGNFGWVQAAAPTEEELGRMRKAADIQKQIEQLQQTLDAAEQATRRTDLRAGKEETDRLRARFFGTHEGMEKAYSDAKKDVEKYQKELFEPEKPLTKTEVLDLSGKLRTAQGTEARWKAALDTEKNGTEQLKEFRRAAAEFEKKGDEAELSAIEKIYYQRDLLLKQAAQVKATEADIAAIRKSADEQASVIMQKSWEEFEKYDQKRNAERSKEITGLLLPSKEQLKEWGDIFGARERIEDIGVEAQREVLRRRATREAKAAETPEEGYRIRVDLAVQLAEIEVARIQKEDSAAKRMEMAAHAQKDLYTELAQAQDELNDKRAAAEQKRTEELQRQVDEIQKVSSGLLHTLFTKPGDFPRQLGSTVRDAALKPITEGLGGTMATFLQPLIHGQSGEGGIGGILRGVGVATRDPVTTTVDNTAATMQNSNALWLLTAVLSESIGRGMPAMAAAGSTVPNMGMASPSGFLTQVLRNTGGLPRFAEGGITTGPTIVGEAGPEMVIPLSPDPHQIDVMRSQASLLRGPDPPDPSLRYRGILGLLRESYPGLADWIGTTASKVWNDPGLRMLPGPMAIEIEGPELAAQAIRELDAPESVAKAIRDAQRGGRAWEKGDAFFDKSPEELKALGAKGGRRKLTPAQHADLIDRMNYSSKYEGPEPGIPETAHEGSVRIDAENPRLRDAFKLTEEEKALREIRRATGRAGGLARAANREATASVRAPRDIAAMRVRGSDAGAMLWAINPKTGGIRLSQYIPDKFSGIRNELFATHADWFEKIGFPVAGEEFDKVPRGYARIDKGAIRIIDNGMEEEQEGLTSPPLTDAQYEALNARIGKRFKLPGYAEGGTVGSTGTVVVHQGEAVVPQADTLKRSIDALTFEMHSNTGVLGWFVNSMVSPMLGGRAPSLPVPIPGIGTVTIPSLFGGGSGGGGGAVASGASGGYSPVGGYSPAGGGRGGVQIPLGLGSAAGGGSRIPGSGFSPHAMLASIKGTDWGGFTRPTVHEFDEQGFATGETHKGGITGMHGVAGAAAFAGGTMLAQRGLMGQDMGTWGGVAEGAAGGAAIGFTYGGPLGAAIGGAVGAGIGIGEKIAGVKSPAREAHDDIKAAYGVDIPPNSGTVKQVVELAKSQFGGSISVAVRSPSVRQLVMLYSEATGQKMPLSAATPYAGSLVEQGGSLYQQASFQNNSWNTYASNLPTLGGIVGGTYPTPGAGGTTIALNINGQPITPEFVTDQSMAAQGASYGRTQQAANMQVPGLMVA